jgi:tyrosyl-tRNA synthetase
MTLSEELSWRGFVNQTTYKDVTTLDGEPISFYWGVDPSADSMTVGNLSVAMMIRHFINHGHKAFLLVGGATGLIGDPDGKASERQLMSSEQIAKNKAGLESQYRTIFAGQEFTVVDNYDWFKDMNYLQFLRDVGKHVPLRQMVNRDFVQSRLGDEGSGISYAEFSYSLIQGYDFLHLYRQNGVTLQVSNSITGVDLIRRMTGAEVNVWCSPLIVNKVSGAKFGKTENGAVWLDPNKTSPTTFYQFWVNCDDDQVADFLKIYTLLDQQAISEILSIHQENRGKRIAQIRLAEESTMLVHGEQNMKIAKKVTELLTGDIDVSDVSNDILESVRKEIPHIDVASDASILDTLTKTGLTSSNTEARQLITSSAIYINNQTVNNHNFKPQDFKSGKLILRRGKAFKDSALIESK